MEQVFCANCGKGSKKSTWIAVYPRKHPYDGNMIVVKTRHSHPEASRPWTEYIVWDGESYEPFNYGHFCTYRCSCQFANAAVRAGFVREKHNA